MSEHPDPHDIDNPLLAKKAADLEAPASPQFIGNLVLQAALEIGRAAEEIEVFDIIDRILVNCAYAAAVFNIGRNFIRLDNIIPTAENRIKPHMIGTSIDLPGSPEIFKSRHCFIMAQNEVDESFSNLASFINKIGCPSFAIFPIHTYKQPVRLVVLSFPQKEPPTEQELYPYACLAVIASQALERIQKSRDLLTKLENYTALEDLNQSISVQTDLTILYKLIHQKIAARMGSDLSFAIAIYHSDNRQINIPYLYEAGSVTSVDPFPLGEGLTTILLETKKSIMLVRNVEEQSKKLGAKVIGKSAKSWLGVPLIIRGEAIGAIIVQDVEREGRFIEKDRIFLETLAPQLAIAIRNAQLLDEMTLTLHKYDQEQFLLNSLLDNIPEKVYFKDANGQYIRASCSWLEQLRPEQREDIFKKTDLELFAGESGAEQHDLDLDIIFTKEPSIGVIEQKKNANGETIWEWTSRIPLFDSSGRKAGLLGILQDITELKKTELISSRRAQHLQTASEIARDTTVSLETQQILKNAVNLIRDRFDYYHASVFLLDARRKYAVLHEASGEIGDTMKKIGHRLEVGSSSLVGQATAFANTVVVNDTHSHQDYYPNPLLPDTHSEVVIPLKIGDRVLGAIDVQSSKINAFSPEDVHILEILADQLSVALENAELFRKTQDQISKQKLLRQLTTAASTASDLDEALEKIVASLHASLEKTRVAIYFTGESDTLVMQASAGYSFEDKPADMLHFSEGIVGVAAARRQPILHHQEAGDIHETIDDAGTLSALAVPIIYLDELLGVLSLESNDPLAFDDMDRELMGSLGDSLGVVIANIRLLRQIRNQVETQQKIFDISGKIRQSVDIDTILRTTAQEIGEKLGFAEVVVQLAAPEKFQEVISPLEEK